jgi:hypothetical protein
LAERNITVTTNDIVALYINYSGSLDGSHTFTIENSTDLDEFRKIVHMTFEAPYPELNFFDSSFRAGQSILFVLSPDRNTGYALSAAPFYNYTSLGGQGEKMPYADDMQQMLNSFELVVEQQ